MIFKLLTEHQLEFLSLIGDCRGWSESTHVKMPHCWKSHALAHFFFQLPCTAALTNKRWASARAATYEQTLLNVPETQLSMIVENGLRVATEDSGSPTCTVSTDIGQSALVKVFRIIPEFRILRLTIQRKSVSKC